VDAQSLGGGHVEGALSWLELAEANPASVPGDFNWHGFAEAAAANARSAATLDDAAAWASISVRAYERVAARAEQPAVFELAAMNVRSWMIVRYGACDEDRVRDLQRLRDWFRRHIPMPLAHVEREAARLRTLPIDRWGDHLELVRTLRALKNRIDVFRPFEDVPDDIRPWVELWPVLP
jgi:hypothetical protein